MTDLCITGCGREATRHILDDQLSDGTMVYILTCGVCYQKQLAKSIDL